MKSVLTAVVLLALYIPSSDGYTSWSYTNESEVPYYGLSPPVYPSPAGDGSSSPEWAAAYARAKDLVAQLTLEEKVNTTRGFDGPCVGNSGTVPRLGIESMCFADAPDGIRGQEFVSAFPAGIHVAATFDRQLMSAYGKAFGQEYRGKGINVALGPVAGPLGRVARGGRNWEGLSNDPYLAGAGMGEITRGMQLEGVISTPKHWLLNEQEFRRRPSEDYGEALSSNADDRTIHELYVFPFMNSFKENAGCLMCGYNRVNNSYNCQNSKLLNGILKTELGFEGFVVSDWNAQYAGVATTNAGLDIVMPDGGFWDGNLTEAVNNGSVAMDRVDDMVTRKLATFFYMGQDTNYPEASMFDYDQKHLPVNVQGNHGALIREIGAAGTVLVKNVNNTLPLKNPTFLSIYGYDATVKASPWENPSRYGGGYEVNYGWNTLNGTLITGGGSGSSAPPYVVSPFNAIQQRIARDNGILRWDFYSEQPSPAYVNSDACLVFINAYASESFDRTSLTDDFSDNLVKKVASMCHNTIVIVHSAGIRTVDAWIEHPNVTAVIFGLLPGQESGDSLADVLYGDVSPSGRLPFTVARAESDYGHLLNSTISYAAFPQDNFTEGLYIDYRHFDKYDIAPRFEFGFGLSYTTFSYADLSVSAAGSQQLSALPSPPLSRVPTGGHPALWATLFTVSVSLTNTGDVAAHEVPQLYLGIPSVDGDTPAQQLRGFDRVWLAAGESKTVEFELARRDLSVWDVEAQQWRLRGGTYKMWVGASSRDLRVSGEMEVSVNN
ncbi:glycosyl hydrolase family 3 N terminal domain-containing protein [Lineolata rhizophorae]|uniref:beta-glucosidase n=1 Tax=Lineolata rhizophorae TaxID=578093 RepID=A0A6A6NV81_9PEZI|nr:glycosyl hydrolase family 3 N terminal domain-containing protein [Lineolata rhizophorae]